MHGDVGLCRIIRLSTLNTILTGARRN